MFSGGIKRGQWHETGQQVAHVKTIMSKTICQMCTITCSESRETDNNRRIETSCILPSINALQEADENVMNCLG